ncbi:hypothetical protein [Lactiplantibacillus plantarum]|uniref:hypothetical protein n=1 Tax=Lactiplantibacillus plantarum TaxID=1590 RepID=UPI00084FB647|nr:hypothetical protein [Lactiplantibacillus plantarum]WKF83384.1 hypothetical protein QY876_05290 [Lactiplantibacillus plantarum]WKF87352.1 hypothetical protein QY875_13610 [Lactiplantibacillus plantarum]
MSIDIVVRSSVSVKNSLPKVMRLAKQTVTETGKKAGYSQPMISKLSSGVAKLPYENVRTLLNSIPEQYQPLLALDIAHELVGITPPIANGDGLKLDVEALGSRTIRELSQGIDALTNSQDEFETPAGHVSDTKDPQEAIYQVLDALFIGYNAVIGICNEYGFSLPALMRQREKVWKMKSYIK